MNNRVTLAINAVSALLLGWLYGGDALEAVRSRTAEVSAFIEPPNLAFAAAALAATAVGAGATLLGLMQKRDSAWRGYRLMPIVAVVVLFADLFILTGNKSPLGTTDRTALTVRSFADAAASASRGEGVLRDPVALQALVDQFGTPAYLLKGTPARAWTVVVREGCQGPVTEAKGEGLGTVFYCVSEGARHAWVTLVALPAGTTFGAPAVFSRGGEVVVGDVGVPSAEAPATAPEGAEPADEGEPGGDR